MADEIKMTGNRKGICRQQKTWGKKRNMKLDVSDALAAWFLRNSTTSIISSSGGIVSCAEKFSIRSSCFIGWAKMPIWKSRKGKNRWCSCCANTFETLRKLNSNRPRNIRRIFRRGAVGFNRMAEHEWALCAHSGLQGLVFEILSIFSHQNSFIKNLILSPAGVSHPTFLFPAANL